MRVEQIMASEVQFCTPRTQVSQIVQMMAEQDCGAIPVVENERTMRPVGMVTDGDVARRVIAAGKDIARQRAADCMTAPAVTVPRSADAGECFRLMIEQHVHRAPVVDEQGRCCGIIAAADIAVRDPHVHREIEALGHPWSVGITDADLQRLFI